MSNLIDRQVTIDEWKNDFKGYINALNLPKDDYNGIMEYIDELPSAQQDPDEWCLDCKEYDQERHSCPRWNRVIRQTVEDMKAEAQPERKEGTWVLREDLYGSTEAKCSECGFETLVNEEGNGLHEVSDLHYCPNCGADMRGDDNDKD